MTMDDDILNRLEEKIRAAVEKMEELRQENRRLTRQLEDGNGEPSPPEGLEEELRILQDERATVRSRIEGLIDWMEAAS
jgi:FtsZ-binding cell division protein ZapB